MSAQTTLRWKDSANNNSILNNQFIGKTLTANEWTWVEVPYTLTTTADIVYRFWTASPSDFHVGGYQIPKYEPNILTTIESHDYSTEPTLNNTNPVDLTAVKDSKGTWVARNSLDLNALKFTYNNDKECIKVIASDKYIWNTADVMYGFKTTFPKGDYSVNIGIKPDAAESYKVSVIDRKTGAALTSTATDELTAGVYTTLIVPFSTPYDTDVVLSIETSDGYYYSQYRLSDVSVYKLVNPISELNSNGSIAYFEPSSEDAYYTVTGITGKEGYVNYSNGKELSPGTYKLSGYFRTDDADGANLTASIGQVSCGDAVAIGSEWKYVEYTVTLTRGVILRSSRGICFNIDSAAPFAFKELTLNFVEELPQPAVSSGIAMVLLKKLQGKMKPQIKRELYNFLENGDLDSEPVINAENLNYAWNRAVDGEWGYSVNPTAGEVKLEYSEYKGDKCLKVTSGAIPAIYHAMNRELEAGVYSLNLDLFIEGGGTKTFSFDAYNIVNGSAIRTTEGGVPVTLTFRQGEWVTVNVPFVITGNGDMVIRFWCGNSCNYYIDNVSITRDGYYADGTVETVTADTEGLIENGGFDSEPIISAKSLNYIYKLVRAAKLTKPQMRRFVEHYFYKKTIVSIANEESVSHNSVACSLKLSKNKLKKYF